MRCLGTSATLVIAAAALTAAALTAPASASALALEQVGSFDRPTYVTSDPADPGRLFVVERSGRIQLTEGGSTSTFLDIEPIVLSPPDDPEAGLDQALMSMAFSPDYASNHLFYVAYSGKDDPSTTEDESGDFHIDELASDGDTADPGSRREVLTIEHRASQGHYGGQLQFGPDGYLYASTGDGSDVGDPLGNAQNTHNLLGKILRIDPSGSSPGEYTVPAANPFADTAGCSDGCDEIWSYGLRNPWRFSFDQLTGAMLIGDVGQDTWEEVDFEPAPAPGKGDNFGWNCREGMHDYPGPGESSPLCADRSGTFTEPVFEYEHLGAGPCWAITGGYVVRDRALDELYGRYLYADNCIGELHSLQPELPTASGDRSEGLSVPLVTSFGQDADCRIYVTSFDGPVYRLTEPASGGAVGCQPPDTSIDSGPADGSTTSGTTPTFEFSSTEPNSTFECKVDGGRFFGCNSPHTTAPLADGGHSFAVRALSRAGKPDPTPASRNFVVETSSPPGNTSSPPEPASPSSTQPLTLDLSAKKQELGKKLKLFVTASVHSTLVATGKKVRKSRKELAANQRTKVKAELKRRARRRLEEKLDNRRKAKVKINGTATDSSGATAKDKLKVKLKD